MKKTLLFFLCLLSFSLVAFPASLKESFELNWNFTLLDSMESSPKFLVDCSAVSTNKWKKINLPHDWAFEKGYHPDGAQKDCGGYAVGGIGLYKKVFEVSSKEKKRLENGEHFFLDFEGVYMNSEVWINGIYMGKHPYGYTPFSYEISKAIKKGKNIIFVRVDNSKEPSARWYHPCGIYAPIHLRKTAASYFLKNNQIVRSEIKNNQVELTLISKQKIVEPTTCLVQLFDGKRLIAEKEKEVNDSVQFKLSFQSPKLWSPEHPYLYKVVFNLKQGRNVIETKTIPYGFRTLDWKPATGFYLNGKVYKLRGVCEHLEGGPLGGAYTPEMLRWKLQLLKDMGVNAIRTAHNPQVPFFYDLCDEMGLLVMDELFDGWRKKAAYDYGQQAFKEWWKRDLTAWVQRDRNHPSIFVYSLGNETGGNVAQEMVALMHQEDPTRLCTSGHSGSAFMDVVGVNGYSEMKRFLQNYKVEDKAFVGTETPHTWQVRGYYRTKTWYRDGYPNKFQDPYFIPDLSEQEVFGYGWTAPENRQSKKQIYKSSYDNATVRLSARHNIEFLRDIPWYSGSFRWTGFDYRGEAGYVSGGWPFRLFSGGALDVAGFPKDLYYLYQSEWATKDMVYILPHWSFPKVKEGTIIPVCAYTSGDEVELFLNGKSLGRKKKGKTWDKMQCVWQVPYTHGIVEAVAYRNGKEIARDKKVTEMQPVQLSLHSTKRNIKADKKDIAIITISELGEQQTLYPFGENRIFVKIEGPARIFCFENGCPVDVENPFQATSKKAFFGLARLFLQSTSFKQAPVTLTAGSILGKHFETANLYATVAVKTITLNGRAKDISNYCCYYTTDGTEPTLSSKVVSVGGQIPYYWGDVVRVKVYDKKNCVLSMREEFTSENSLYWGEPGEAACSSNGLQAESAKMDGAFVSRKNGVNFFGKGWVEFKHKGAFITFYQENDGGEMQNTLSIRYAQQAKAQKTRMQLYNNDVPIKVLDFKNTGSLASHWKEYKIEIPIHKGGNNIKLMLLTDEGPNIDQIELSQ